MPQVLHPAHRILGLHHYGQRLIIDVISSAASRANSSVAAITHCDALGRRSAHSQSRAAAVSCDALGAAHILRH